MPHVKKQFAPRQNRGSASQKARGLLALLVLVGALTYVLLNALEPTYGGKRLSHWLADARSDGGGAVLPSPALEAVRHLGTNAFPPLVQMLTASDSNLKRSLLELDFTGLMTPAEIWHERALAAFRSLGPDAKEATPLLLNLLTDKQAAPNSVVALTLIGPDALAPLVRGFRALDPGSRRALVDAAGKNFFNYPANIPFLVECLQDEDAAVRRNAARFLGEGRGVGAFSKNATKVIQALAKALQDQDQGVRAQAALSLSYHRAPARSQASLPDVPAPHGPTPASAAKPLSPLGSQAAHRTAVVALQPGVPFGQGLRAPAASL